MAKGAAIVLYHSAAANNPVPGGSIGQGELALDALASPPHLYTAVPTTRDPSGMIDLLSLSQLGMPLPVAVASGGTGAATGNAGFDNLAGVSGNTTGWLNRNAAGQWVLTNPATLFAPLTNPASGQNNYAPLASPTFTGTVTMPDGSAIVTAGANNGLAGATYGYQNVTGLGIGIARSGITPPTGGNVLILGQTGTPCLYFQPTGYGPVAEINYSTGITGGLQIAQGAYINGSNWVSTVGSATVFFMAPNGPNPSFNFYCDHSLTVGSTYNPTLTAQIWSAGIFSYGGAFYSTITNATQLFLGSSIAGNAGGTVTSGLANNINLGAGCYYGTNGWIANATTPSFVSCSGGTISFAVDAGVTTGLAYSPTPRAYINTTQFVTNIPLYSSYVGNTGIIFGSNSAANAAATLTSVVANNFNIAAGAYYSQSLAGWVATASNPLIHAYNGGQFQWYQNTGATVGAGYSPTMIAYLDTTGAAGFVCPTAIRTQGGFFLQGGSIPAGTYLNFGAGAQTTSMTLVVSNTGIWYMRDGNPDWLSWNPTGPAGGNGAYQNISDIRAKTNVASEKRGLEVIKQLSPIIFQRRMPEDKLSKPEIGFSAQDVRPVLPEAVTVVGSVLLDGSGGLDSDEPSLAVTESTILALMVNAIKQLDARLSAMERN